MNLIVHQYDSSSFSEKVRLVLGLKGFSWGAVAIPSTAPKPAYTPLTAGYRRTPALQRGADVYCDTRLIVEVLDELRPEPPLFPPLAGTPSRTRALTDALAPWAESQLFWPLALYVTGQRADDFPVEFHLDRAGLHGKPPPTVAQVKAAAQRQLAAMREQLGWIEDLLSDGQPYLLGAEVTLADIMVYQGPWFLESRGGHNILLDKAHTRAWMKRVASLGHGVRTEFGPDAALNVAREAAPRPVPATDYQAPEGVAPGQAVVVAPLTEFSPARGELVAIDDRRMVIRAENDVVGVVHVHFPRIGYRVRPARPGDSLKTV